MKNITKNTIFRFYNKKNMVRYIYQALFLMVSTTALLCKAKELSEARRSFSIQELLEVGRIPQFDRTNGETTLDLSHKQINSLVGLNNIDGINQVTQLGLRNNRLETLEEPGVFEGLDNLEAIDLGHNQLRILMPDVFAGLDNLAMIWLHNNPVYEEYRARNRENPLLAFT